MIRPVKTAILLTVALCLAGAPAQARKHGAQKPDADQDTTDTATKTDGAKKDNAKKDNAKKDNAKKDGSKPQQVASFGDWGAYLAKVGKGKTCYALASPKERRPDVKREAAYVFISDRPAEKVHDEVSIIMGFALKESGKAEAKIGRTAFDLVSKGSNAWIKNPEDEARFVEALQHSGTLIVKAAAAKGPPTVDSYALDGVKQALARVGKDCK